MSQFVVHKTIKIKAEPSIVWDALTDPEKTKKYFFNCKVISDWKPGNSIIFKGTLFLIKKIELAGKIMKINPGKLLKYTLRNGHSDSFSIVTDELTYENGTTTLSITDDIGSGKQAEKRYKQSEKAWDKVLAGLKKLVEEGTPKKLSLV